MNKYKKLIGNSIVFGIGNLGSKLITLIMVPLYTFVLSPSQYGKLDIITTTISLLVPVMSMSIGESVIRFVMLEDVSILKKESIFSNAIFLNCVSQLFFFIIVYPILSYLDIFGNQLILFSIILFLTQIQQTLSQFTRGIGLVKIYALNGILMTIITASLNILFLLYFKLGLNGYLLSIFGANLISSIFLFYMIKGYGLFSIKNIEWNVFRKMTQYSIPLIPNMIMWWMINGSTRFFILYYLGPLYNGLFAVANKVPSILSVFTTIFQQAWQLSAFEEYQSKENDSFFSKIFELYSQLIFMGCSLLLVIIKILIPYVVEPSYIDSWKIIPMLLMAVAYQSFSSFIGTNYTSSMKTKGVFLSSLVGGGISVSCNIFLLPNIGLTGASISIFFSFFGMFIYRYLDTKKIFDFSINKALFIKSNSILFFQILFLFLINTSTILIAIELIFVSIMVYVNRDFLKIIFNSIINKNI